MQTGTASALKMRRFCRFESDRGYQLKVFIMENDLFTKAAYDNLKYLVTEKERVIKEKFITIDDEEFEMQDLYDTLSEIGGWGNVYVTDPQMSKMLVKYGVLKSGGSMDWPASAGPNFDDFLKMVESHL